MEAEILTPTQALNLNMLQPMPSVMELPGPLHPNFLYRATIYLLYNIISTKFGTSINL